MSPALVRRALAIAVAASAVLALAAGVGSATISSQAGNATVPAAAETLAYGVCLRYQEAESGFFFCSREALYRIQLDGSRRRLLAKDASDPDWSADGRRIAFTGRGGIWVARADGSGRRRVTREPRPGRDREPSWAPDGRRIVFQREREYGGTEAAIDLYVLELRTGRVKRLTHSPDDWEFDADWSPDGRQIVFAVAEVGIFVLELSSGRTRRLVATTVGDPVPRWSPDGRRIAYVAPTGLVVVRRDGTGRRILIRQRSIEALSWSPDGSRIVYSRFVGRGQRNASRLMIIRLDKPGGARLLLRAAHGPDWRPRP